MPRNKNRNKKKVWPEHRDSVWHVNEWDRLVSTLDYSTVILFIYSNNIFFIFKKLFSTTQVKYIKILKNINLKQIKNNF